MFNDGTMQSFEIVSNNKRTLNLQTIYMENGDYQKKKFAESLLMKKSSADVQDVGRSNFNNSILNFSKNVKKNAPKMSLQALNSEYMKAAENGDAETAQKYVDETKVDIRYSLKKVDNKSSKEYNGKRKKNSGYSQEESEFLKWQNRVSVPVGNTKSIQEVR